MIAALALSTALVAQPLPQNYLRLSCIAEGAEEPTFLIDFPTVEYTKMFRGDIRTLYRVAGAEGSIWDAPKATFVMDSWPTGLFIEYADAALSIDIERAGGPILFALEQAHEHEDGEHADDEPHDNHAITGTCTDITEEALK